MYKHLWKAIYNYLQTKHRYLVAFNQWFIYNFSQNDGETNETLYTMYLQLFTSEKNHIQEL